MKIIVATKRVIDYSVRIRIKPDGSDVETNNIKMSMNPFDEIAVEEAVRLKEAGIAKEIIVVSIGVTQCQDILRNALALGADRGIWVSTEQTLQPLAVAALLKKIILQENPQIVFLGKQAIDSDNNQVGQMLAGQLGWPQATFASKVVMDNQTCIVTREIDGGLETLALTLPCIITTDLRLNEPRYATLPNIMKSKSKPLTTTTPSELDVDIHSHVDILSIEPPPVRKSGIKFQTVAELVSKLREEGVCK